VMSSLRIGSAENVSSKSALHFALPRRAIAVFPEVFDKGSNPSTTALAVGVKMRRLAGRRSLKHNLLSH